MTSTTSTNPAVILDSPEHYYAWFAHVKGSVPKDLWMYFDPEGNAEFVPPVPVTFESIQPGALSFQQLSAPNRTHYTTQKQLYNSDLAQYQRCIGEEAKLCQRITASVSVNKQHQLREDQSPREWLVHLRNSTKPSDAQMELFVRGRHRLLMLTKITEWPAGGPTKWLTDWEKLMADCERWCPALSDLWASDFRLVWGELQDAKRLCDRLGEATREELANDWDIFKASGLLQEAYAEKTMRSGMRTHNKGKVWKGAMSVQPRFDGEEADRGEGPSRTHDKVPDAPPPSKSKANQRKRAGTESTQQAGKERAQKGPKKPCWGCDGAHGDFKCWLINGQDNPGLPIPVENQQIFLERMKDPDFANDVEGVRVGNRARSKHNKGKGRA